MFSIYINFHGIVILTYNLYEFVCERNKYIFVDVQTTSDFFYFLFFLIRSSKSMFIIALMGFYRLGHYRWCKFLTLC